MLLVVTSSWTYIHGRIAEQTVEELDDLLAFTDPGAFFDWRYKKKWWDGKVRLFYNQEPGFGFPTGLLKHVTDFFDVSQTEYTIDDRRETTPLYWGEPYFPWKGFEPHPQQIEAFDTILTRRCGILNLATNFGKTELAAALFLYLDRPALFLVDRKGLARDTVARFRARGVEAGFIGDGVWDPRKVTVATVQTLMRGMDRERTRELLLATETLVVDEAQRVTPAWYPILSSCPASVRIGLGATVTETTKPTPLVEAYLGPMLMIVEETELIADGRSARPITTFQTHFEVLDPDLKWPGVRERGIVYSEGRNLLVAKDACQFAQDGRQTLVLVQRIPQGAALAALIAGSGVRCHWLHGEVNADSIDRSINRFTKREFPVIVGSGIFDMGRNIPVIEAFVNAAGGLDDGLTTQRGGRSLRRKPGENVVYVRDYMDTGHGMLQRHSEARWKLFERKGYNPHLAREAV